MELTASFGWTTCANWFEAILAHDPAGCFVARIESPGGPGVGPPTVARGGRPVAMVTTTPYGRSAWVGNLVVSPQHGTIGLGTVLLEHALIHLDTLGMSAVHLDGDRPGLRIYERHGFVARFLSRRYRLTGPARHRSTLAVGLRVDDLPEVARLDFDAFGDDRARLLRLLHGKAEAAFATSRGSQLTGYALVMATNHGVHLGPWVAEDRSAAAQLLAAADLHRRDRTLTVGVPGPNQDAIDLLELQGFEEQPASLHMTRGAPGHVGTCERIFGIGNGAIG